MIYIYYTVLTIAVLLAILASREFLTGFVLDVGLPVAFLAVIVFSAVKVAQHLEGGL